MSAIDQVFAELRSSGRKALMPFVTAGDPDLDFTADVLRELVGRGSTLLELAGQVHKDYAEQLKFARVWGSNVHDGTVVKGDYVLRDKDVVELHT